MNYNERIKTLQNSEKNVFSASDLRRLWKMDKDWFRTAAKRMVDSGILQRLSNGYYLFGSKMNPLELANTVIKPSYVSYDSALRYFDINFQERKIIFSSAAISYEKNIAEYKLKYHKIKDDIFFNLNGIKNISGIAIASPERAILDGMYQGFLLNIDRTDKINKEYLIELSKLYPKFVQNKAQNFKI